MARLRVLVFLSTIIVVGIIGTIAILYARGFRLEPNSETLQIGPTGLLVVNSDPKAAQVIVNGDLKTATDNALSLSPGDYQISVKKEGYLPWDKKVTIEKEAVTQVDAFLISAAPSLTALTFSGAINPRVSEDFSKIAYVVPEAADNIERAGLWIIDTVNLPLGFNRDPRRITDGDLTEAQYQFSPDSREILLTTATGVYNLDTSTFTAKALRVNIAATAKEILAEWNDIKRAKLKARISPLPDEIENIFGLDSTNVKFSPDENRILYTASTSATIPEGLVRELPGSSTQAQERNLKVGTTYVYDIREDRNFAVAEPGKEAYWLPNSLNLALPEENKISILDYDGTNRKTVFTGNYTFPHAYPSTNANRILLLTNFGAIDSLTNLYWLSLK